MKEPTDYPEDDWLALSGLQHFAFCRRQWALIHIEQQWQETISLLRAPSNTIERMITANRKQGAICLLCVISVCSHDDWALPEHAMWSSSVNRMKACHCMGGPVLGFRILWNTSMVFQSRWMRIVFNFVRKPCVWKKCWLARFRKVACSISRLNDGSGCNLMSRCVGRSSQ